MSSLMNLKTLLKESDAKHKKRRPHRWGQANNKGKADFSPGSTCVICGVKSRYGKNRGFPTEATFTFPDGIKTKVDFSKRPLRCYTEEHIRKIRYGSKS